LAIYVVYNSNRFSNLISYKSADVSARQINNLLLRWLSVNKYSQYCVYPEIPALEGITLLKKNGISLIAGFIM